jgi:hypothetical protein
MAITILSQPTGFNVSQTPLVYEIESDNANRPQFRYICEVEQGNEVIATLKAYPNKFGKASFDISDVCQNSMDEVLIAIPPIGGFNGYLPSWSVTFKEEYASDLNSNPVVYDTGPRTGRLFTSGPGYKNINDDPQDGYNRNLDPYDPRTAPYPKEVRFLTDNPLISSDGFVTPSEEGRRMYISKDSPIAIYLGIPQYPGFNRIDYDVVSFGFDELVKSVDSVDFPINDYNLIHEMLTPSRFPNLYAAIVAGEVKRIMVYTDVYNAITNQKYTYQPQGYSIKPDCEIDTNTTFTWRNSLGQYDFYCVFNPVRKTTNIQRNDYDRTFVRYEDNNSGYSINNRGKRQYLTTYADTYEVTTDWLNERDAKYLSKMFEADTVGYYQIGLPTSRGFTPIDILDNSYEVNNSTSRNKLFQYTIRFSRGLQRQSR